MQADTAIGMRRPAASRKSQSTATAAVIHAGQARTRATLPAVPTVHGVRIFVIFEFAQIRRGQEARDLVNRDDAGEPPHVVAADDRQEPFGLLPTLEQHVHAMVRMNMNTDWPDDVFHRYPA